jgi:hypothetical protein
MVSNVSFNEEYWSKQPLSDFISEAAKHKWSEHDAIVYHKKIQAQFWVTETPQDKVIELTEQINEANDNAGDEVITESFTE